MAKKLGDRRSSRTVALVVAASLAAMPAAADVLEIKDDGSLVVRSGAGAVRFVDPALVAAGDAIDLDMPADVTIPAGAVPTARRGAPPAYADAVARIAAKYEISPALLEAVVWQESRWQPNAVSRAGAVGLAQLMPATARTLGVDARDPIANLEGGARFLRTQLNAFDGDVEKALAAYNAGPSRVVKAGGIPRIRETQTYVAAIIGRLSSDPEGE